MLKNNKKLIVGTLISIIFLIAVITGIIVYKANTSKLYKNDGIYYSQQDENVYLQFAKDKTFSMISRTDENTAEISKGTWTKKDNKITIKFTESGKSYVFLKTKKDYLYREDTVFRGKTNDDKLLNNRYVLENNGKIIEEMWFLDDGTMDHKIIGDSKMSYGTYTRVGDILIVRYDDNPSVAERYLVLENGITKDIYHNEKATDVAK